MTTTSSPSLAAHRPVDLLVVGAGVVGLSHALEASDRGASVVVLERDERAVGASVRNFGHGCFTAQDGVALDHALAARERWLALAKEVDLGLQETGTLVVARADDERAVLEDLATARDGDVRLLDRAAVLSLLPDAGDDVVGGAHLPLDVRLDQRRAVAELARHLDDRPRAAVRWSTTVHGFEPGADGVLVRTSRGTVVARRVVVAVGHDVDRHFPELAAERGVRRCALRMLRVGTPRPTTIAPAVLTGTSLLRYGAFAVSPALESVRERLAATDAALLDADVNLMLTQRPDGTLTLGDTHHRSLTPAPFQAEELDELLLSHAARLLPGAGPLRVVERWRGVYASAPDPFLVAEPQPGVHVVSVTSGIGMTTAPGLAAAVLNDVL
ncbi:TIGR03364 family FAD-dependent oxidoreductase [Luteimicrobium sp. DT211]|uniref:TIGR03364 family FAD-dependent oxidoreductase n=1 Tax=Luteimicrobium sp. DT211 TaxID=3393412 RepID=UPI003CEECC59